MHKVDNGGFKRPHAVVWLILTVLSAFVFFWPDHTIAHVDDLFFVPWAAEYAATGNHINPLLAVQFPGLENYHLYTRFHLILAGHFFELFGTNRLSVVTYEYLCFLLTSLAFSGLCLMVRLPKAALFAPLLFAPMYVVTGFRLEITACVFWVLGLFLLFWAANRQDHRTSGLGVSSLRTAAKLALAFAPLASPALFAWSLGAIVIHDIWRIAFREVRIVPLVLENAAALLLGLLIFSLSIDFQYREFVDQIVFHAARSTGQGINDEALGRAVIFAVVAGVLTRWSRSAALLCLMLSAGQGLAAILHDKVLVRNLAASMVFLVGLDAVTRDRFQRAAYVLYTLVFLAVSANFLIFYVLSGHAPGLEAAARDYGSDIEADKRVFIDETMAHHYLDHQTRDAISWTWGRKFPLARAEELSELRDGEVWYLSPYTLFAYLKGHTAIAKALEADVTYRRTPQLPCVMGRHSCRLPADGWTMLRLEREGDQVRVTDYALERVFLVPGN
ncbi:hypothetical protein [uncultured Roseibium sp.]|uniref:hypothetical protein n=1 Tax=uncultured Roseibium sp. TaxID=1936171 RepID=UPI00260F7CD2|nr:hypothetical protein [uncultured Roseibium sp.]